MTASQLKLETVQYDMLIKYSAGQHYKQSMSLGKSLPSTKTQVKFFISNGICLDILNNNDVTTVESLLNKHGFCGDYKYTKSKSWVRLQNSTDLHEALKLEFL